MTLPVHPRKFVFRERHEDFAGQMTNPSYEVCIRYMQIVSLGTE